MAVTCDEVIEGLEGITEEGGWCDGGVGCGEQVKEVVRIGVVVVDECDAQRARRRQCHGVGKSEVISVVRGGRSARLDRTLLASQGIMPM